jgi:cytochrome c oxidase assembly protein subunit 11
MSQQQANTQQSKKPVSSRQVLKLLVIPVLMFGFGFALVPLYSVFCSVTGLNGKTGRVEASTVNPNTADLSRTVLVKFIANQGTGLPWTFEPLTKEIEVHPGKIYKASYRVSNRSDKETIGQAIPSLSPNVASLHFNKTECFCFSQQKLAAHETRDMPIRFVIDRELPEEIVEVTLSYTFFDVSGKQG